MSTENLIIEIDTAGMCHYIKKSLIKELISLKIDFYTIQDYRQEDEYYSDLHNIGCPAGKLYNILYILGIYPDVKIITVREKTETDD